MKTCGNLDSGKPCSFWDTEKCPWYRMMAMEVDLLSSKACEPMIALMTARDDFEVLTKSHVAYCEAAMLDGPELQRLRADTAIQRDALERIYKALGDTAQTPTQAAEYVEKLRCVEAAAVKFRDHPVTIERGVSSWMSSILAGIGPDGKPLE